MSRLHAVRSEMFVSGVDLYVVVSAFVLSCSGIRIRLLEDTISQKNELLSSMEQSGDVEEISQLYQDVKALEDELASIKRKAEELRQVKALFACVGSCTLPPRCPFSQWAALLLLIASPAHANVHACVGRIGKHQCRRSTKSTSAIARTTFLQRKRQ